MSAEAAVGPTTGSAPPAIITSIGDGADLGAAARQAASVLKAGGLVVAPIGSSYAVLADASNAEATARIFQVRSAERAVPLAVVIHNPRKMPGFAAAVPESAERLMAAHWPGPLTLVLRAADGLGWDLGDTQGYLAVRMPEEPFALMVINQVGPLALTAAAPTGSAPALTCEQARAALGDQIDLYVDGGERTGEQSTIVDLTRPEPTILRSGAIGDGDVLSIAAGDVRPWEEPLPVATPTPDEIVLPDTAEAHEAVSADA